jgi:uncharacterized protein (DUF1778 family)
MERPKRAALIKARCQARELEIVRTASRVEGVSISEFARSATLDKARRVLTGPAAVEAAS